MSPRTLDEPPITGLVLSGGGARGAYEAGVVAGIVEVLGRGPRDPSPFTVFAGTSVGAINTAFLAAQAHRGDLGGDGLSRVWTGLRLRTHLRPDPMRLLGWRPDWPWLGGTRRAEGRTRFGHSLLDPGPLDRVVAEKIPWERLKENVRDGRVHAAIVTALHVASGRTTMFVDTPAGRPFKASRDPRRRHLVGPLTPQHVLASSAIPLVFPARRVTDGWYCDGGLRFNTPVAPAIRAGARRLVVVSLAAAIENTPAAAVPHEEFPNPIFLLGKVLDALLLDPMDYDLQVLERLNRLVEVLEQTLDDEALGRVQAVMRETRGVPYRKLNTLIFRPSKDLGVVAREHLAHTSVHREMGWLGSWLLRRAAMQEATWEDDLASYILFDGGYAERLVALGRQDAAARADEVRAFFAAP